MNNLDKIIEKITSDAAAQAEHISAEGDCEILSIESECENTIREILKGAKLDAEKARRVELERAHGEADMKGREIILAKRVDLINEAFEKAEELIISAEKDDYIFFLSNLLCDAARDHLEAVDRLVNEYGEEDEYSADFELIFNEKDKKEYAKTTIRTARALLKKSSPAFSKAVFSLSDSTADIKGGFILRCGDIETNCSLEAVMADARRKCEDRVIAHLFPKEKK